MKVGLIARMDKSGLGQGQTLRLARLLGPAATMVIDSTIFNGNIQYPEWYNDYNPTYIDGFPTDYEVEVFLKEAVSLGVSTVVSCETFYNPNFTRLAEELGIKTVLIANWEFLDYLKPEWNRFTLPNKIISPSFWHLEELERDFIATYLPTPIFDDEFVRAREINVKRTGKRRYLFLNGKSAIYNRNGLESIYAAIELCKGDFEIVIKSQSDIVKHPDPRIKYDFSNPDEQWEIYKDFDAMILPRRYAGQCLPMCEALLSGLPVIMTDISPNNQVLPKEWLVGAHKTGEFMTRVMIDLYTANTRELADMMDNFEPDEFSKLQAYGIGKQFEAENLREQYTNVLEEAII